MLIGNEAFEHHMAGCSEVAPQDSGQGRAQGPDGQVGKKPKAAEVDTQDRPLPITHLPGCSENGAIATKNQGDIGVDGGKVDFLLKIENDNFRQGFEPRTEVAGGLQHAGSIGVT